MLLFDLAQCSTILPQAGGMAVLLPGNAGIFVRLFGRTRPGLSS